MCALHNQSDVSYKYSNIKCTNTFLHFSMKSLREHGDGKKYEFGVNVLIRLHSFKKVLRSPEKFCIHSNKTSEQMYWNIIFSSISYFSHHHVPLGALYIQDEQHLKYKSSYVKLVNDGEIKCILMHFNALNTDKINKSKLILIIM